MNIGCFLIVFVFLVGWFLFLRDLVSGEREVHSAIEGFTSLGKKN